jgi:hypothetical protein
MNTYQEKRQARIERLERAVMLCKTEAIRAHDSASKMADMIPFGQPILIGHHSERRDRAYRSRIQRRFEKGFELDKKAEYYQRRLDAAKSNNAISSDNPDAVQELREKLDKLELLQAQFKTINKIIKRKSGTREEKQKELEIAFPKSEPSKLAQLFEPDFCGRIGVPDYQLTNNNANMRRIRLRIEELEKRAQDVTKEVIINGVRIVDNVEENRLQLFFNGKPAESVRNELKHSGFRWSPYNECWQRMRSNGAIYNAKRIINNIKTEVVA